MIMNGRASLRLPSTGLLALALLAAATLPAWATGSAADESWPEPQATQSQATQPPSAPKKVVSIKQTKPKPTVKPKPEYVLAIVDERQARPAVVSVQEHPPSKAVQKRPELVRYSVHLTPRELTDEGQKLVTDYSTDVDAIQKELQAKLEARREAAIQALQELQDQYTKAGKLDEAVAIRDYLKAGGPDAASYRTFYRGRK